MLNLVTIFLTRLIVLLTFGRPCQPAHFVYQQWKGLFEDGVMVLTFSMLQHLLGFYLCSP